MSTGSRTRSGRSPGRLADLVLWEASSFGVKPVIVFKGGVVAWTAIGEGNASVHGAEPTRYGADWGGIGRAASSVSTTFVSAAALDAGIAGPSARVADWWPCGTRSIRRDGLAQPDGAADRGLPRGRNRHAGREVLSSEPAGEVPLSRRYLLA